jgi:hypothetical protein
MNVWLSSVPHRAVRYLAGAALTLALFAMPAYGLLGHRGDAHPPSPAENAQNLNIGFNGADTTGADDQLPYIDQFFTATEAYYEQQLGRPMPGDRHCHAYVSWDIAEQPTGSGSIRIGGSRAWFEQWLANYQGHCDQALITFKYVKGASTGTGFPTPAAFEAAFVQFQQTSWAYTGWTGTFAFTAWNEPNNGSRSGDGLTTVLDAHTAADYYLAIRKHCSPAKHCLVAAGDFGSNGNLGEGFVQNCTNDRAPLCSNATYMDTYKHYLVLDARAYGLAQGREFRPELFSYHGWDDINDYINQNPNCNSLSDSKCTIYALLNSLSHNTWKFVEIWDTEVGAGQNPQTNPNPVTQACAAAFLLNLTASASSRITRLYYTRAWEPDGQHWSLFDSAGAEKPAFTVLADRSLTYTPPAGSTCP